MEGIQGTRYKGKDMERVQGSDYIHIFPEKGKGYGKGTRIRLYTYIP